MTTVFTENENNDIFLNQANQISISSELSAVIQLCDSAIEIQAGEAIYNIDDGVPTESTVWSGAPNLQQFEFFARRQLTSVPGVEEITEFNADIENDVLRYNATIKTIFGNGVVNGIL